MKTLATSSSIVRNNSDNGYFPSFLKQSPRFGPQIISFRKHRKFASNGFQNLVSVRREAIGPLPSLSLEEQVSSLSAEDQNTAVENQNANQSKTVHVKFQLQKECTFGEQFLIVGDDPMFGSWDVSNAIPLTWSDGHQWETELDIPVGETLQFKFVLQEKTGNVVWQPDPDRSFQSWETSNTIIVCEDWDNAESQMLMEEQVANQNKDSPIAQEKLIVAQNLTYPNEELVHNKSKKPPIAIIDTSIAQKLSVESHRELIDDSNISVLEENVSNISTSEENGSDIPPDEENASNISPSEESAKGITKKLESLDVEESLTSYGVPILVPGLPPTSTMSTGTTHQVDVSIDGVDKSVDHKISEIQMNQKQDLSIVAEQEMEVKKSNHGEDNLESDMRLETNSEKIENYSDLQPSSNNILKNDVMWSHKTLLKFFTNFRLL